ncbi:MAG: hypothetical protein KDA89_00245 [Planctomycetaceae bacterium]|nr:hypothetical protein [Planctomycetaceae bacterium]
MVPPVSRTHSSGDALLTLFSNGCDKELFVGRLRECRVTACRGFGEPAERPPRFC